VLGLSPLAAILSGVEKEKNWAGPSAAALPRGMNLFGGLFLTAGGPCASPHSDVVKTAAVATLATPIERIVVDFILSFHGIGESTDVVDETVKFPFPSPSCAVTVPSVLLVLAKSRWPSWLTSTAMTV